MPSNASRRLDETMATEIETLSLSSIEAMQNVLELLYDMLQAVNSSDCTARKDEVIVELVNYCRANQKKLMQMLTSTGDEELLAKGLELNNSLQSLLAKHDTIDVSSPLPAQLTNSSPQRTETSTSSIKQSEVKDSSPRDFSPRPNVSPSTPVTTLTRSQIYEEEEEEDEFAQLARRHSKAISTAPQSTSNGTTEGLAIVSVSSSTSTPAASTSAMSNALALPDPPAPVKTKEQDIIDLLSITLSTTEASPLTPHTPSSNQNMHQVPVSASTQAFPRASQTYSGIQGQVPYNSYVAPWAQPHQQTQPEAPPQPLPRAQAHPHVQPQSSSHVQPRPSSHVQPQASSLVQPQPSTYSSGYPPPPWAATPGYYSSQGHFPTNNAFATHTKTSYRPVQTNTTVSYTPAQSGQPLQHHNSFPARENGLAINGESRVAAPNARNPAPPAAQKPFIPSYRLFEDLNVFGSASGNASSGLAGTSGQSMVGGRK